MTSALDPVSRLRPSLSNHIPIPTGARIDVSDDSAGEGGWWFGVLDGIFGWFPSAFTTLEFVSQEGSSAGGSVGGSDAGSTAGPRADPVAASAMAASTLAGPLGAHDGDRSSDPTMPLEDPAALAAGMLGEAIRVSFRAGTAGGAPAVEVVRGGVGVGEPACDGAGSLALASEGVAARGMARSVPGAASSGQQGGSSSRRNGCNGGGISSQRDKRPCTSRGSIRADMIALAEQPEEVHQLHGQPRPLQDLVNIPCPLEDPADAP